jgi:septal ring factor EnvC (AmiA/AmiB activator)
MTNEQREASITINNLQAALAACEEKLDTCQQELAEKNYMLCRIQKEINYMHDELIEVEAELVVCKEKLAVANSELSRLRAALEEPYDDDIPF